MSISIYPVLGYQNLIDHSDSILSSASILAGSDVYNLADPNLGVVADFGTGTSKSWLLNCTEPKAVSAAYVRFREGWDDIQTIRLWGGENSDGSSPLFDTTYATQIPATWDIGAVRRPIFRAIFDEISATYWGITVTRTAGATALTVAREYVGPMIQLAGAGDYGAACHGSSVTVDSTSVESTGDLDTDFRFARGPRRQASIKVEAIPTAAARIQWLRQIAYAGVNRDVLYVFNPLETDEASVQFETLWGSAKMSSALTWVNPEWWECTVAIRERL